MKTAVITFTAKGQQLAESIRQKFLPEADVYCYKRYATGKVMAFDAVRNLMQEVFYNYDRLLFISAAAIAVRAVAPYLQSKLTDPAVLVTDENAEFVISLLSGHIGGANAWCEELAKKIGAVAVITTATDKRGVFAVDTYAKEQHLRIANPQMTKEISGKILNGESVGIGTAIPQYQQLCLKVQKQWGNPVWVRNQSDFSLYESGIQIVEQPETAILFQNTLRLVPMDLAVGIGCKKGKSEEDIKRAVLQTLQQLGLMPERIGVIASIDRKAEEAGIIALAKEFDVPFHTYSAEELKRAKGSFTASDWVNCQVGVDNVCERSACIASGGGIRIAAKTVYEGITVAVYQNEKAVGMAAE